MLYQRHWLNSYTLLLRWQALRLKPMLPLFVVVQLFVGIGTVIGLGYLFPEVDPQAAIFLITGAPTLALITLGLVIVPQMVAQARSEGAFEYIWSLPVPRLAFLAADVTIWLLATGPGVILALVVGASRYGLELQISPLAAPAFLLVALTATSVGYAVALLSPHPQLVPVLTNFIVFFLFMFSPINFPVERLPGWLATLHSWLPVQYAADVVRGTLSKGYAEGLGQGFAMLSVWCAIGLGVTCVLVTRRR